MEEQTNLQNQYELETRKPCYIQSLWVPEDTTMPSWDYVRWLEAKVERINDGKAS